MSYYYKKTEPQLWTVGCDDGEGWYPESDHDSESAAAERVRYLNGGYSPTNPPAFTPGRYDWYLESTLCGLLANPDFSRKTPAEIAQFAIDQVDALFEALMDRKDI